MPRASCQALLVGLALLGLAALLALSAAPVADLIDVKIHERIQQQLVWQPESPKSVAGRYMGDNMPPDYFSVRFFNITNVDAVRTGAKPQLQEVGPYVFAKARRKVGVHFVRSGASVRYHDYLYHTFVPELSNGSMGDVVTTLNVPLVGALEVIEAKAGKAVGYLLELLAGLVEGWGDHRIKGLFTTRTVGELMWGYEDALLAQLARWVPRLGINPWVQLVPNTTSPAQAEAGFETQMNTGLDDLSQVWQTEQWHNITEVTCWAEGHVEAVRGTDAQQFRPGLAVNDTVHVWVGELFRAVRFHATEQVDLGGVPLVRLRMDPQQTDPDPRFFQTMQGLLNITGPMASGPQGSPGEAGPPLFLSYPHFCGADRRLAEGVEGLHCQPEYLDKYLDVEPTTGITLRADQGLMLVSWFGGKWGVIDKSARDTFLPIFWGQERSEAGPKELRQLAPLMRARLAQRLLRQWGRPAALCLAVAAVVSLCAAAVLWVDCSGRGAGASSSPEATAPAVGYERLENGSHEPGLADASEPRPAAAAAAAAVSPQRAQQQQPVSFPVAAEHDAELEGPGS